jgi:SAM-dependent methyltransferase
VDELTMTIPGEYSFTRYLSAKKTIDDRALNRHVWQRLQQTLPSATPETPLRVLEIGAGIGTMIERALEWDLLNHATYTALDNDAANITEARRRMSQWAISQRFALADEGPNRVRLRRDTQNITAILETIDLFDFIAREQNRRTWDLLIAHAFVDLVDVPTTLPALLSLLKPGGLFYFTLVFDGDTILQPEIDPSYDAYIERLYHQTMDRRMVNNHPSGDSQTGRHLFQQLSAAGAELLAAGSSDWVVFPGSTGYPANEAYFLHFIIHTMHTALTNHPDLIPEQFADWIVQRHAHIETGELVYIAHQLDFLGQVKT